MEKHEIIDAILKQVEELGGDKEWFALKLEELEAEINAWNRNN